jgi:hypothetical protein
MNVFELTRALVDIESITNNEERVGNYLYDYLTPLALLYDGQVDRVEVEAPRFNVVAQWGEPLTVALSTHIDTVPPFIASREHVDVTWGRGTCDTEGVAPPSPQCSENCGIGEHLVASPIRTMAPPNRAGLTRGATRSWGPRGTRAAREANPR